MRTPEERHAASNHRETEVLYRLNPLTDPRWDKLRADGGSASFFHGASWARVLHETYGFSPVYFTEGDSCHIGTLLPIMEVNSVLTGRRGVSLPFTDECEPVAASADSFKRVLDQAVAYGKARAWRYLEIRGGTSLLAGVPASTSFFGHRLELANSEAELFSGVEPATRRAIRKAEHAGLTVEFSRDLGAVRAFYRLLCKTRKRLGAPPQPFRFFSNIQRYVLAKEQGSVVLVRHGRTPVAGAIFFHFGKTVIFKFGASDGAFQHLRPSNMVMWEAIKHYARQGCVGLDFGRTSISNMGLRKFKLGWGATERQTDYARFDLRLGGFLTAKDEASGWQTKIFKILPCSISRLIGGAAYKHIA